MRVAVVSKEFPPRLSGIADHTDLLATELAARDVVVTVVCADPAERRDGFAVESVGERWDVRTRPAIERRVRDARPDAVVWAYNPFSFGSRGLPLGATLLARSLGRIAPLVVLFHELWFPWGRDGARGLTWASVQRLEGRGVLRAATRWIVTTEQRARELVALDPERVRRIPVGSNVLPAGAGGARDSLGIPRDAFVVAHLGSAGPGRDLAPAFDAVARLRAAGTDARLLLAGNTGPLHAPATLNGALHRTGVLPRPELSAALASADVYLHADPVGPSAGRRTTLVAALAHGLPVVAYRGPDAAPQLNDGGNIVLVERDAEALADTLRALAAEPERRRALGNAALSTYEREFSWKRIGDDVVAVLREVVTR